MRLSASLTRPCTDGIVSAWKPQRRENWPESSSQSYTCASSPGPWDVWLPRGAQTRWGMWWNAGTTSLCAELPLWVVTVSHKYFGKIWQYRFYTMRRQVLEPKLNFIHEWRDYAFSILYLLNPVWLENHTKGKAWMGEQIYFLFPPISHQDA